MLRIWDLQRTESHRKPAPPGGPGTPPAPFFPTLHRAVLIIYRHFLISSFSSILAPRGPFERYRPFFFFFLLNRISLPPLPFQTPLTVFFFVQASNDVHHPESLLITKAP